MGLAEPRVKQRISADPRNLAWSNDQTKYGYRMLSKMGWSPGKGLGINEDGNKEHTKVSIKRDNLGIGADTNNSINNWLDNSNSFDELLKGLNDKFQTGEKEQEKCERDKKSEQDIGDEAKIDKVKSKKKKKNRKENSNKNKKSVISSTTSESSNNNNLTANISDSKSLSSVRLAHRAKFLKSKKAAIQDSDRLNEILGIKSNRNSSKNSDNTNTDVFSTINTSIMTASSSNSDESDMNYSRKNIRKVDTTNKVNEMSINEYFAQKMKGLRTPPGTANRVNYNETNDDTDKQSSMGESLNLMDNNTSLKSSRSISNCSLKLMSNKKRKIDHDIDIESS